MPLISCACVVDLVAHERQIVDDALRIHAVLFKDPLSVVARAAHRVDERHVIGDHLRKVLVARGNHNVHARFFTFDGKRGKHIVGLNARNLQQGNPLELDELENRRDLHAQLVGHGRTIGLVLRIDVVTKILSGCIKNAGRKIGLDDVKDRLEHPVEALDRSGRLAAARR